MGYQAAGHIRLVYWSSLPKNTQLMTCDRGKATPDEPTKLRLFADSAGRCQKPDCLTALFFSGTVNFHIAEMAHICAASDSGPRSNPELTEEERGAHENLILLCPTCHTKIDKAPANYPDEMILEWKAAHNERIAKAFGALEYKNREDARSAIEPFLAENRTIFDTYGPHREENQNPESELAGIWQRKVLEKILPNNRAILMILDANRLLLMEPEISTLESFRQHVDDLEARHLNDVATGHATRFPAEMSKILKE